MIPLARWADLRLARLARETESPSIAALSGAGLMSERARLNGFAIPGAISPGGGCRLLPARGDWIALNLARPVDRESLPALFGDAALDPWDDNAIAARVAGADSAALLAQGRTLGLALAAASETPQAPAIDVLARGPRRDLPARRPVVLDLSALWAGPLAGHLLWLAGADVVKVEHPRRPDAMRDGDPALFARLNRGKASVALDFTEASSRAALLSLIARADIVIEAARPRALLQAGIDAEALVAAQAGLVWLTITAHGACGVEADWVGFGDDAGVAGGLTAALLEAARDFPLPAPSPVCPERDCTHPIPPPAHPELVEGLSFSSFVSRGLEKEKQCFDRLRTSGGGLEVRSDTPVGFGGDAPADPLTGIVAALTGWRAWRSGQARRIGFSMSGIVAQALAQERAADPAALTATLRAWSQARDAPFPSHPDRTPGATARPLGADNARWLTC